MTQARDPQKICSRIGLALFSLMLIWLLSLVVFQFILAAVAPGFMASPWSAWIINDVPLYFLGVPVYLLILHFAVPDGPVQTERKPIAFGPGKYVLFILFCMGATWLLNIAGGLLLQLLQSFFRSGGGTESDALTELVTQSGALPTFLFGVCVPAVGEEFLFRYMLHKKMRGCGDKIYILFSALCFALFHANPSQLLYAFVLGAVFAWLYANTQNIWIPVSMHFIINFIGTIVTPKLAESDTGIIAYLVLICLLIPTAIVFFFVFKKYFFSHIQPPHEAGWPYKQKAAAWPYAAPVYYPYAGQPMAAAPPVAAQAAPPAAMAEPPAQTAAAQAAEAGPGGTGAAVSPPAQPAAQPAWPHYGYPAQPGAPGQMPYPGPYAYPYAPQGYAYPPQLTYQENAPQAGAPGAQPATQPYAPPPHAPAPAPHYGNTASPPLPGYGQQVPYWRGYGYVMPKPPGAVRVCLANVGMILYLVLSGGMTVLTLLTLLAL